MISNSMPIRDVDRFGQPRERPLTTIGNRGVSGIDGIVSTALGAANASSSRVIVLIGDLAFFHDMNGLIAMDRCGLEAIFVVVNNNGGGIFRQLPIAEIDPPFTDQFLTPHDLDFEHVAGLYGLEYVPSTPLAFTDDYEHALAMDGSVILDVSVNGAENEEQRHDFQRRIEQQLLTVV